MQRQPTPQTTSYQTEKVSANQTRSNRCQDGSSITPERRALQPKRKSHQLLTALLTSGLDRLAAVQQKTRSANLGVFSNLRYQDRRSAGNAAAAACAELRARPEMTVTATGPLIQIGAVFPRARVRPAALDRRRIGCSATPPSVEPQGGHATDQTSHGCMMKPIGTASSAGQQPKQGRVIPPQLCVNE